mmetsp:Transcript_37461/g.41378  ORF Transcript_37461/g.41378 Transcript_37461/m.41378 type:complete len:242 (-) Transcript_37461:1087-1812(-)
MTSSSVVVSSNLYNPAFGSTTVCLSNTNSVIDVEGSSYLCCRSVFSNIVTSPRAPVPSFSAILAISFRALSVAVILMPYPSISRMNCFRTDPSAPANIFFKSPTSSESNDTRTGTRPTNSGSRPVRIKSAVSANLRYDRDFFLSPSAASGKGDDDDPVAESSSSSEDPVISSPNGFFSFFRRISASNCVKAPENMNRIFLVLIDLGFLSFPFPPNGKFAITISPWRSKLTSVSSNNFRKLF